VLTIVLGGWCESCRGDVDNVWSLVVWQRWCEDSMPQMCGAYAVAWSLIDTVGGHVQMVVASTKGI
jgi:hypothetical protein